MPAATKPSPLIEALHKLNENPAIPVCKETPVAMPTTRFVADHFLATHIARSKEGFAFIPDESIYQTYAILSSANEAWRHDKLPAIAVCAFLKSPGPFQRETGIQADTVDQFLSDLTFAHRIVPSLGASPAYIIRHYHSPNDRYDEVILPAHANLVVYQPHAIAPKQLRTLFEHVASVNGKIILCDDRQALLNSYPELTDAVDKSLTKAIPRDLKKDLAPPASVSSLATPISNSVPPQTDELSLSDTTPTRTYLIYHARTEKPAEFPGDYVLVAKVEADSIHRALADSQHYARPWTENPGVVSFTDKPRSTQPGDIICHDGVVQRLGVADFELIMRMDPPLDRSQKPDPAPHDPEPDQPEPVRPRPKIKP